MNRRCWSEQHSFIGVIIFRYYSWNLFNSKYYGQNQSIILNDSISSPKCHVFYTMTDTESAWISISFEHSHIHGERICDIFIAYVYFLLNQIKQAAIGIWNVSLILSSAHWPIRIGLCGSTIDMALYDWDWCLFS